MKFVYALIAVSLGVIAFGMYLIVQEERASQVDVTEPPVPLGLIPATGDGEPADTDIPQVPPEPGSEEWCEMMMLKADELWQDSDSRTFAANCIYQE